MFFRVPHKDGSVSWHTSRRVAEFVSHRGYKRGEGAPIEQVFIAPRRNEMLRALNKYATSASEGKHA